MFAHAKPNAEKCQQWTHQIKRLSITMSNAFLSISPTQFWQTVWVDWLNDFCSWESNVHRSMRMRIKWVEIPRKSTKWTHYIGPLLDFTYLHLCICDLQLFMHYAYILDQCQTLTHFLCLSISHDKYKAQFLILVSKILYTLLTIHNIFDPFW